MEGVIGHQGTLRQPQRHPIALLVVAAQQEEDLGLEGVAPPVGIEVGQEGVLLEGLEQQHSVKHRMKQARQGGLADADDAFNRQVHRLNSWRRRRVST